MTTVGIATGAGRGIGLACGQRLADMVDVLLLVDQDQASVIAAAAGLAASGRRAAIEPFVLDITDSEGLGRLAARVDELGTLSAVAHAAGISPAMADWRRIFTVNLTGTAMLAEVLRPLTVAGTATVYLSSMSPTLGINEPNEAADAALDDPLHEHFLDRIHDAIGSAVQDPGLAYVWAKQGVRRFAQQEAVRIGPHRARVCSLSPGIIDTPHSQLGDS